MKDLHSSIKVEPSINPAAIVTGNVTLTGATIDKQDYDAVEHVVVSGTITDSTFTGQLFAGDAANMSDEVQVTAANELIGTVPVFVAADDNVTRRVGYRGPKRYSRLKLVQSGATTGGFICAIAVKGDPKVKPVA